MPIYEEPRSPGYTIRISPSAALELFWVSYRCCDEDSRQRNPVFGAVDRRTAELGRRVQRFWDQGDEGFPELIVIAQRRGLLLGDSVDDLLSSLPSSALHTDDLTLASETAETRALIIDRLDRLRSDAALRRRYLALLRELWRAVRAEWETVGLAAVKRACGVAQQRLDSGEHPADLVPQVSAAAVALLRRWEHGEIYVCPGYFTGRCVWEVPGVMLVGMPAEGGGELMALRARAELMAPKVKALADPTRLAILLRLGRGPASITDVTREFGISQPAVSVHFRVLREAELLSGVRAGTRTLYSIDQRHAVGLVEELAQALGVPSSLD